MAVGITVKGASVAKTENGITSTSSESPANKTALGLMRVYIVTDGNAGIMAEAKIVNLSQNNAILAQSDCEVASPEVGKTYPKLLLEGSIDANVANTEEAVDSKCDCRQMVFKASDGNYIDGQLIIKISGYSTENDITVIVDTQGSEDNHTSETNLALKELVAKQLSGVITYVIPFTIGSLS